MEGIHREAWWQACPPPRVPSSCPYLCLAASSCALSPPLRPPSRLQVSLLQPPPEVVEQFDNIMLMREGHVVFHGPRSMVMLYFANMGLVCPDDTDSAGA
jgi:hypothetical protein